MTSEFAVYVERNGKTEGVYEPQPHQAKFHAAETMNCLMEGGAGSGKSICMRWDAYVRCLRIPRFRALILRRSMPELKMSHLDEIPYDVEKLGLKKEDWHITNSTLRFPNGSILVFGHVEDDATIARYLSSEWDAIYFDELTTFTLRQFLFLSSRARTTKKGLKAIVRAGTNPVGPGASWVKRYFLIKDISPSENPGYKAENFEAQHSTVDDNAYVDTTVYAERLNALGNDALVRALRYGEWVIEGQFFPEFREIDPETGHGWHVIDQLPKHKGRSIIEYPWVDIVEVVDWGYAEEGNPGMVQWWACLPGPRAICFMEWVFKQTLPADVSRGILARRGAFSGKLRYTVMDTQMWAEHEGPSVAELMAREGVSGIEADKSREAGWVNTHAWLRETAEIGTRLAPRLQFLKPAGPGDIYGCPVTIRTLPSMVVDQKNPADMETRGVEDEGADCTRYFVMSRPTASKEPGPDPKLGWIFREIARRKSRGLRLGTEATRRA
jgi:hypothetical protein